MLGLRLSVRKHSPLPSRLVRLLDPCLGLDVLGATVGAPPLVWDCSVLLPPAYESSGGTSEVFEIVSPLLNELIVLVGRFGALAETDCWDKTDVRTEGVGEWDLSICLADGFGRLS